MVTESVLQLEKGGKKVVNNKLSLEVNRVPQEMTPACARPIWRENEVRAPQPDKGQEMFQNNISRLTVPQKN